MGLQLDTVHPQIRLVKSAVGQNLSGPVCIVDLIWWSIQIKHSPRAARWNCAALFAPFPGRRGQEKEEGQDARPDRHRLRLRRDGPLYWQLRSCECPPPLPPARPLSHNSSDLFIFLNQVSVSLFTDVAWNQTAAFFWWCNKSPACCEEVAILQLWLKTSICLLTVDS